MEGLSTQEKISLSDIRFQKSQEMLSDAISSFKIGMYKTSVNRSYYAVLHSSRSLLILKGIDPLRHEGVKTMLSLHFIKGKILLEDSIKIFKNLMALRTDVDYGDFEVVSKSDADKAIKQAKKFIRSVESVRGKLIKELSVA